MPLLRIRRQRTLSTIFLLIITACSTNKAPKYKLIYPDDIHDEINATLLLADFKTLSSDEFEGRKTGTLGNLKARNFIESKLATFNTLTLLNRHKVNNTKASGKGTYRHSFTHQSLTKTLNGQNLVALVKGSHYSDKYIVLSAHFDHLGSKGRLIFNGADDNASGTAALLNMAKNISENPLRYSVIFLFTDAEESNLLGAKAFLNDFMAIVPHIKLNINLDMIAGSKNTKSLHFISKGVDTIIEVPIYLQIQEDLISHANLSIKKGFRDTNAQGSLVRKKIKWLVASDHGAFNRKKIPFIYFGVGAHENYHTRDDTFKNINQQFYLLATQAIYRHIRLLDYYL